MSTPDKPSNSRPGSNLVSERVSKNNARPGYQAMRSQELSSQGRPTPQLQRISKNNANYNTLSKKQKTTSPSIQSTLANIGMKYAQLAGDKKGTIKGASFNMLSKAAFSAVHALPEPKIHSNEQKKQQFLASIKNPLTKIHNKVIHKPKHPSN